jgi:hypothetical protein
MRHSGTPLDLLYPGDSDANDAVSQIRSQPRKAATTARAPLRSRTVYSTDLIPIAISVPMLEKARSPE